MASSHKSNTSWSSILLSILLIIAIAAIIYVLSDIVKIVPKTEKIPHLTTTSKVINIPLSELATKLTDKFINPLASSQEKNNVRQTINNTLMRLTNTNSNQALESLQSLDFKSAITFLTQSVKQEENPREAAKIWVDIGNLQQLHSSQLALFAYKKASKLDSGNTNAWNRLGHYYRQQKQFSLAENAYTNVLQLSNDNMTTKAVAYANFGLLHQAQSKLKEAEEAYLSALEINKAQSNIASLASNSENLAIIYKNNNVKASEKLFNDALTYYKTLKQNDNIANTHTSLASLYHQNKQLEQSKQHYETALTLYQENNTPLKIASSYSNLGIISQQQNDAEKAKVFFDKALEIYQATNQEKGVADQYGNLGILYRSQKNFLESERSHLKSLSLYEQLSLKEGISQQQTNLGFLYQTWNKTNKACDAWLKAQNALDQHVNASRIARLKTLIEQHCTSLKSEKLAPPQEIH